MTFSKISLSLAASTDTTWDVICFHHLWWRPKTPGLIFLIFTSFRFFNTCLFFLIFFESGSFSLFSFLPSRLIPLIVSVHRHPIRTRSVRLTSLAWLEFELTNLHTHFSPFWHLSLEEFFPACSWLHFPKLFFLLILKRKRPEAATSDLLENFPQ